MRDSMKHFLKTLLESYTKEPAKYSRDYQTVCRYHREEEQDDSTRRVSNKAQADA